MTIVKQVSNIKIYFGKTPLLITDEMISSSEKKKIVLTGTSADALALISDHNSDAVMLKTTDVQTAFKDTFSDFQTVIAGGGIVKNDKGEILIIYRRKQWDLPKGHLDKNETIEECALREVREETGLNQLKIINADSVSYHVYRQNGKNILKETHWFLMHHSGNGVIKVQTDEDIEEAQWVDPKHFSNYYSDMFPLIRDILDKFS